MCRRGFTVLLHTQQSAFQRFQSLSVWDYFRCSFVWITSIRDLQSWARGISDPPPTHRIFCKTRLIRKFTHPNIPESQLVQISDALLHVEVAGRSPTEAMRLRFYQQKSRLHWNSRRVVIGSWSRLWEKRHYELKVGPVGDFISWSNRSRVTSAGERP
jgi:hypothetical protein